MVKRCKFCGRYFVPDKRAGDRQQACRREECRRARKQLAQAHWVKKNPGYFKGRYAYVKTWRARRNQDTRESCDREKMIQDEIPVSKPLYKLVLLIPGGAGAGMIQDEIIFKRLNRRTFVAYGKG
jgi:hypothetical protein